jgi:histidine triad (HIT) family protein
MTGCPYCDTLSGAANGPPRFLDDGGFVGFMGRYQPTGPGYALVVPRAHVENLHHLAADQLEPMLRVVQQVSMAIVSAFSVTGTTIMQNNGPPGQRVEHLHFHVVPRNPGDGYPTESTSEVPLEELERQAGALRAQLPTPR